MKAYLVIPPSDFKTTLLSSSTIKLMSTPHAIYTTSLSPESSRVISNTSTENIYKIRALDKREYLLIKRDNFCEFYIKTCAVTPHLNNLDEMVQMRGLQYMDLTRNKKNYCQILLLI